MAFYATAMLVMAALGSLLVFRQTSAVNAYICNSKKFSGSGAQRPGAENL